MKWLSKLFDLSENIKDVDTLLIHCYAGQSRSRAVGAFAVKLLGGDNSVYFKKYNPNEYVYNLLIQTLPDVQECLGEDRDDFCVSLFEPDMSEETLSEIVYTGSEYKDACHNIEKYCQAVPAGGCWLSYLCDMDELSYLHGEMLSLMEEEPSDRNKKKLAVYAREIDRIVN